MILATTSSLVNLVTSSTADIGVSASWADNTTTTLTGNNDNTIINTATTTQIVGAPAASTQRQVKNISIVNYDAVDSGLITVIHTDGVLAVTVYKKTLLPGESVIYDGGKWVAYDSSGNPIVMQEQSAIGYDGRTIGFYKTGTAADAVGYWYCTLKDAGYPGAFAIGTPGLNGRVTDGTTTTDNGCIPFQNAATGEIYLKNTSVWSSTNHYHTIFDLLWINSGLVVTTTTAQAITTPAFPARDVNGSTDGEGLIIGLLTTTANTNAAVNNTMTVSYTNSAGTAGRTATLSNNVGDMLPATAVIGNIVWFRLQAGDKGVRSIESITLATSLGAGAVSLLVARMVQGVPTTVVNVGTYVDNGFGIKLYDGTCLLHCYKASATTATVTGGQVTMIEQ